MHRPKTDREQLSETNQHTVPQPHKWVPGDLWLMVKLKQKLRRDVGVAPPVWWTSLMSRKAWPGPLV